MFHHQRRTSAKDDFLAVTEDLRAKLDAMPYRTDVFFTESVPILRQAVYRVRRFLKEEKRSSLYKILREYEVQNRSQFVAVSAERLKNLEELDKPERTLHTFFDRFDECVSDKEQRLP